VKQYSIMLGKRLLMLGNLVIFNGNLIGSKEFLTLMVKALGITVDRHPKERSRKRES